MAFLNPETVISALGIEPGMNVADFGCGPGFYSIPIAKAIGPNGKVYALDVQKSSLEIVRSKAKEARLLNVNPIWADLEHAGGSHVADASINVALLSNVLFQSDHKKEMIAEAFRILKSRGTIAVIDWSSAASGGPAPERLVNRAHAEKLLTEAGFTPLGEFPAGSNHYGLLFRKT